MIFHITIKISTIEYNLKKNIFEKVFTASLSSGIAAVSTARYTVWPNATGVTRGPYYKYNQNFLKKMLMMRNI